MRIYLTLISIIFTLNCSSQVQCDKIKEGKFYYPSKPNKVTIRKDKIQKSYSDGKLEMTWDVKWVNDCEYIITCIEVHNKTLPINIGDKIVVSITSIEDNCYYSKLKVFNKDNPNGLTMPDLYPLCYTNSATTSFKN